MTTFHIYVDNGKPTEPMQVAKKDVGKRVQGWQNYLTAVKDFTTKIIVEERRNGNCVGTETFTAEQTK